jgi:ATP-dependent DNA ligase
MEPKEYAETIKAEGKEGVVHKRKDAFYYQDTWVKDKKVEYQDVKVIDFIEGSGKHHGRLGALVVTNPESGATTRVGTGYSDYEREWIWQNRNEVRGRLVRVASHETTERGAYRGPRYEGFHPESGVALQDEQALKDYAEGTGVSPYQIKSAAGWRKK